MKTNTTFIIIAALLVAIGAYWYFFTGTGNEPPLSTDAPITTNQAQTQFESLVGELQSISFKTSIFSDARFTSLVDITTSISPEPFGRTDPLAPISSASAFANPVVSIPVISVPTPPSTSSGTSSPAVSGH